MQHVWKRNKIVIRKPEAKGPQVNLTVDGFDGRVETGFIWLRIHSSGGFLK
jgi:hypothetical protein